MGLSYLYMPYIQSLETECRILTFDYPYAFDSNEKLTDGISVLLRYVEELRRFLEGLDKT